MSLLEQFLLMPTKIKLHVHRPHYEEPPLCIHSVILSASRGKETPSKAVERRCMVGIMFSKISQEQKGKCRRALTLLCVDSGATDLAEAEQTSGL